MRRKLERGKGKSGDGVDRAAPSDTSRNNRELHMQIERSRIVKNIQVQLQLIQKNRQTMVDSGRLNLFEALRCFFTISTKYNAPLASVNCDSDDDRYDIVGCGAGAVGQLQQIHIPLCTSYLSSSLAQLTDASGALYLVLIVKKHLSASNTFSSRTTDATAS